MGALYSWEFASRIGAVSPGSSGAAPAEGGGGGSSLAAEQDWDERSSGAGVVAVYHFEDTTYMQNPAHIHPDSQQANVVRNATGGIKGTGCLRINIPASDAESSGAWRVPLNQAWSADGTTFGTTKFYIQFRVKFGPGRMANDPGGDGGFKICNLGEYLFSSPQSSRSHPGNEIVIQQQGEGDPTANSGVPIAYRDLASMGGDSAAAWFRTDIPSGEIRHQTARDLGSGTNLARYCLYDPANPPDLMSVGCYRWQEGVWYTIYLGIRVNTPNGTSGNVFQFSIAAEGDPFYTVLYDESDTAMGFDVDIPGGPNSMWFLPFKTTRTPNGTVDSYHEYDEPLVSTEPIPCPQVVPGYVAAMAVGEWAQIANTRMSLVDPSPQLPGATGPQGKVSAWNGLAYDPVTRKLYGAARGGHNDYAGNEINGVAVGEETPYVEEILASTVAAQIIDQSSYYADGRPTSRHHFYGVQMSVKTRRVMVFGGAWWSSVGGTHAAVDGFNVDTGVWDAAGTHDDLPSLFVTDLLMSCEDPGTGDVYLFCNFAVARWNASDFTITTLLSPGAGQPEGINGPCALDTRRRRILLVGGQYSHRWLYDIATNSFSQPTLTGAAASAVENCAAGSQLEYVAPLDCYLLRTPAAGGTIYKVTASGSTLTCTTFATTGGSSIPTVANNDDSNPNGPYGKFRYMEQLKGCILEVRHNQDFWFLRVH